MPNPSGNYAWPLNGDIAEIIVYNAALNDAERIVVENYLSAKYNLTITNTYYSDNTPYNQDVQGIGTTDGTSKHAKAANGKGLILEEANNSLNAANEFLFAGHNTATNSLVTTNLPADVTQRWQRDWYLQKTGTVDASLAFDWSEAGLTAPTNLEAEATVYRLLYRASTDDPFVVVTDGTNPLIPAFTDDDQLEFMLSDGSASGVGLTTGYYTLGVMASEETFLEMAADASRYINSLTYTLYARPLSGAAAYAWEFSTTADFSGPVALADTSEGATLSLNATQLVSGEKYFVRIQALNESGEPMGDFTTAATVAKSWFYNALHPVNVTAPAGYTEVSTPTLVAGHVRHATGVLFQIAGDPAFQDVLDVSVADAPAIADPASPGKFVHPSTSARVLQDGAYVTITNPDAYEGAQWIYHHVQNLQPGQLYYVRAKAVRFDAQTNTYLQAGYWQAYTSFSYQQPPNTPPVPRVTVVCGKAILDTQDPAPAGIRYFFQVAASGTATESPLPATVTQSGTYYLRARNEQGAWSTASSVSVTLGALPATPSSPVIEYSNGNARLTSNSTPPTGVSWYWQTSAAGTRMDYPNPATVHTDGVYYLRARSNATGCWSELAPAVTVVITTLTPIAVTPPENRNFVVVNTIQAEGKRTENDLQGLTAEAMHQQITYFDGLGRPEQNVLTQASPGRQDYVQPYLYDQYGRQKTAYLPYAGGNDGSYKSDAITAQLAFYQNTPGVTADSHPFARTLFENSPLGTVTEQGAVGKVWNPVEAAGDGKTAKTTYRTNTAEEGIRQWTYAPGTLPEFRSEGTYAAGLLVINEVRDADNHPLWQYTNKSGQVVLKRTEEAPGNYLDTYYLYDDFGLLRVVIPPQAVEELTASGASAWLPGDAFLHRWCYTYRYDARKRPIESRTPGTAGPVVTVYNQRDEPVLSQDANQRRRNEWSVVKYDVLGRPVLGGIARYPDGPTRQDLQSDADLSTAPLYEERTDDPTHQYYTNRTFPPVNLSNGSQWLSVTYYDHYDFNHDGQPDAAFNADDLNKFRAYPSQPLPQPRRQADGTTPEAATGLVTGTKVKVLGSQPEQWLRTVAFYDEDLQPVQVQSENHRGGLDVSTTQYDFAGKAVKSVLSHTNPEDSELGTLISLTPTYDHMGRVKVLTHHLNEGRSDEQLPERLAQLTYNELGQLTSQVVGNKLANGKDLQKMDYRYNIRGWLTHLNNATLSSTGENDLFGMEFTYDPTTAAEPGPGDRFDGNITKVRWKSAIDNVSRGYQYTYDGLSRLKEAAYSHDNPHQAEDFSLQVPAYDKNGNILRLRRSNLLARTSNAAPTFGQVDDLTYNYTQAGTASNRLLAVSDAATGSSGQAGDFVDGPAGSAQEYVYDDNGNLLEDKNRGITSIVYNELDLPRLILFGSGGTNYIEYTYDGAGSKLGKQVYQEGSLLASYDYLGSFVYRDDELEILHTPLGRAIPPRQTGSGHYQYEYHYNDQLGNLRVAFRAGQTRTHLLTMETGPFSQPREEREFDNVAQTRSNGASFAGSHSALTNQQQVLGPWKTIKVGKGDLIQSKVQAHYRQEANNASGVSLVAYLQGLGGNRPGAGGEESQNNWPALLNIGLAYSPSPTTSNTLPKAYLKLVIYDKDYHYVSSQNLPVTAGAKDNWEELSLSYQVQQDGYVQVLVANESEVNVWFDHLEITHQDSPIVQENHYDPFGMNLAGIEREGGYFYGFNLAEKQLDPIGKGYFQETDYRGYDPQLGRFRSIDPLADIVPGITPYQYAYNNPISFADPSGLVALPVFVFVGQSLGAQVAGAAAVAQFYVGSVALTAGLQAAGAGAGCCPGNGGANGNPEYRNGGQAAQGAPRPEEALQGAPVLLRRPPVPVKPPVPAGPSLSGALTRLAGRALGTVFAFLSSTPAGPSSGNEWEQRLPEGDENLYQELLGRRSGLLAQGKELHLPDLRKFLNLEAAKFRFGYGPSGTGGVGSLDVALGLNDDLFKFSAEKGFVTYRDFSNGFQQGRIESAIKNSSNKLHFNLTGFSMYRYTKYNPKTSLIRDNITNWELYTIYNTPGALERTTFYKFEDGAYKIVPKPF